MNLWRAAALGVIVFAAAFGAVYLLVRHPNNTRPGVTSSSAWQRMANPGELSDGHRFLAHNCNACHTPITGVEASNCIVCHANNQALLQRQPTAFHANIGTCKECHSEHRGSAPRSAPMDHLALAEIGLRQLETASEPDRDSQAVAAVLVSRLDRARPTGVTAMSDLHPKETLLNCITCHKNDDRHFGLFGNDCVQCHATSQWTLAEFRHPAPTSLDCAQCHQAPPSHYMEHFKKISMTVAGQPHAKVNQCHICHQTTSWPDIKGVGWYKHH